METARATRSGNRTPPVTSEGAELSQGIAGGGTPEMPPAEESVEALQEAMDAARLRLQQRLSDEIGHQRAESDRLRRECEQLRAEASTMEAQAKETAARIVAEARETEARMLGQAQQTVDAMLTRLRDGAGTLLERAATEIGAVQEAILAARSAAGGEPDAGAPAASAAHPADEERVVTRLIVRPSVESDARTRFKETVESLPGVDAALFGAVEDESFEMLIAHEHSAALVDGLLAVAPGEIALIASREGCIELQLTGVGWLAPAT